MLCRNEIMTASCSASQRRGGSEGPHTTRDKEGKPEAGFQAREQTK